MYLSLQSTAHLLQLVVLTDQTLPADGGKEGGKEGGREGGNNNNSNNNNNNNNKNINNNNDDNNNNNNKNNIYIKTTITMTIKTMTIKTTTIKTSIHVNPIFLALLILVIWRPTTIYHPLILVSRESTHNIQYTLFTIIIYI